MDHVYQGIGKPGLMIALVFWGICLVKPSLAAPHREINFSLGVGTHHVGHGYNSIPMLEQLKVKIVRDEISWQAVEHSKGIYILEPGMFGYIRDLNARNMKPVLILCYSNPIYTPQEKHGPDTPELREAFGKYVAFLVSALKGQVYAWEIWNEPNTKEFWHPGSNSKNYSLLVKSIAPIIRKIDPQALIIAGAMDKPDYDFWDTLCKEGALDNVDIISFHWYCPPQGPEAGKDEMSVDKVRAFVHDIRKLGKKAWLTEMGYPTSGNVYGVTEVLQAEFLRQQLHLARDMGIETCIVYGLMDDGPDPLNHAHRYGLFRGDGTAKPAAAMIADFHISGKGPLSPSK